MGRHREITSTKEAGKNSKDAANALFALKGGKTESSGALISNLVEIVKMELAFYRMLLEQAVRPISKEQQYLMNSLKIVAVIIADLINQAIERIKDKLEERQDLYVCENCGMIYYELPEECDVCEAGQSLITRYSFPIKGDGRTLKGIFTSDITRPQRRNKKASLIAGLVFLICS